ncbi:MAG: LysE family transporter [Bacteroidota bacterium]
MKLILEGISLGLLLSIMVGPIFFAMSQLAIERGFRAGMTLNLGVWLSDVAYILVVYFGLQQFADGPHFKVVMGTIGGSILMLFGIGMIVSKVKVGADYQSSMKDYWSYFMKGVAINTVNPFVFFLWIGVTTAMIDRDMSREQCLIYFCSIMFTVAFIDVLKTYLAKKIRDFLKVHHLVWVRRISGIGLIVFGVYIILRVYLEG